MRIFWLCLDNFQIQPFYLAMEEPRVVLLVTYGSTIDSFLEEDENVTDQLPTYNNALLVTLVGVFVRTQQYIVQACEYLLTMVKESHDEVFFERLS